MMFNKNSQALKKQANKISLMQYYCSVCKETISRNDYQYSITRTGTALCSRHQRVVTPQAVKLSKALKSLHIENTLEYSDGFKHVDLAILNAKIYIELDGSQHAFDPQQVCIDDDRDQYSIKDGFITKRYPNAYIDSDVDRIALGIAFLVNKRLNDQLDKERIESASTSQVVKQPMHDPPKNNISKKQKRKNKGILRGIRDTVTNVSEKLENFE